jgi:FkbM family methyltransferase
MFDVGANTGQFSTTARRLFPEAQIHAFEPLPDCLSQVRQLFRKDDRIHLYGCALGEQEGSITFHRSEFSPSSSVLEMDKAHRHLFPESVPTNDVTVPMRRLDDMLTIGELERDLFLKLDVQGYEDRVLAGGEQILRQTRLVLTEVLFERLYQGQAHFAEVYARLRRAGFSFAEC